jgi:hypothetical protein
MSSVATDTSIAIDLPSVSSLLHSKEENLKKWLEGTRNVVKDKFSYDAEHLLHYSQKVILKKNKWKAPLTCD